MSSKKVSVLLLVMCFLSWWVAPVKAELLEDAPSWEFEGMITGVHTNYFTVLGNSNKVIRVMLPPDFHLPQQVIPGVRCKVVLLQGTLPNEWWLDSFEYLQAPPGAPTPNPDESE